MGNDLLQIRELHLDINSYLGTAEVLDNINLTIEKGKWLGLAGESGCGKSMTAYSLIRLLPESAFIKKGSIVFKDKDILKMKRKELHFLRGGEISLVFQEPQAALNPSKRIGKNIIETLALHQKLKGKEARQKTLEILRQVKIPQPEIRFNQFPYELSGGMQQRICLAIALACNPSLLIADEFTTSLDVTTQKEIIQLVIELQKDTDMSVLFITHDLALISDCCDDVIIMYAGQIMESGRVDQVFDAPSHPYTKLLLEAIPTISGNEEVLKSIDGFVPSLINPPKGCRFHTRCKHIIPGKCDIEFPPCSDVDEYHQVFCHLIS